MMAFYIHRTTLIKLIRQIAQPQGQRGRTDPWLRLSARDGKVYAAANQVVAGAEALVLAEGSCDLPRLMLLKLLQSYHGKPNIHITANASEVCIERVRLPLFGSVHSNDIVPGARIRGQRARR